ncbi:hypothetical protein RFI_04207 [Reticulomyxa filosa]|uniref:Uncharacterized protein n=1 Tax=Reticulomyxa filosa TaxID=46433 RepID=X6P466_RETFI|nr:hypothetical protein RFI_04207 [Reticulomyxa filosa]|eukprot:ETO32908.1 hypothetical protein RFI_04207 [Reticulomyxa filosa]
MKERLFRIGFRSANDNGDDDDDETQSMFSFTHLSIISRHWTSVVCANIWVLMLYSRDFDLVRGKATKNSNVVSVDNWVDNAKVAPLFGESSQKLGYWQYVGGGPAGWIREQYFMSAVEPLLPSQRRRRYCYDLSVEGLLLTRSSLKMVAPGDEIFNDNSFRQVFRYFARLNGLGGNIVIEIKLRIRTRTKELLRAWVHCLKKFFFVYIFNITAYTYIDYLFIFKGVQMEMDVYYMKFGMKMDKLLLFTLPLGCSEFPAIMTMDSNCDNSSIDCCCRHENKKIATSLSNCC